LQPVVHQRQTVSLPLRDFTDDEEADYWENEARRYESPESPYGFIGQGLGTQPTNQLILFNNFPNIFVRPFRRN